MYTWSSQMTRSLSSFHFFFFRQNYTKKEESENKQRKRNYLWQSQTGPDDDIQQSTWRPKSKPSTTYVLEKYCPSLPGTFWPWLESPPIIRHIHKPTCTFSWPATWQRCWRRTGIRITQRITKEWQITWPSGWETDCRISCLLLEPRDKLNRTLQYVSVRQHSQHHNCDNKSYQQLSAEFPNQRKSESQ